MGHLHADLPFPITCEIQGSFLHGMNPEITTWTPCTVFGVSSYPRYYLTLRADIEGALFDYLPLHAFRIRGGNASTKEQAYQPSELTCPGEDFVLHRSEYLSRKSPTLFHGREAMLGDASYVCTMDWVEDNVSAHLFLLDGGFYLRPNFRVLFRPGQKELPQYDKIRQEWEP